MATIAELRKTYFEYGKKAGDINRQLALAGVAIIWLLKTQATVNSSFNFTLPRQLLPPTILLVLSLGLDLLQYIWQTALWAVVCRIEEKREGTDQGKWKGIKPVWNWPSLFLFWGKFATMMLSYALLLIFLMSKVAFK